VTSGTLVEAELEFEPEARSEPARRVLEGLGWVSHVKRPTSTLLSRRAASSGLKQSRAGTETPC
jgi:hypothetical protein